MTQDKSSGRRWVAATGLALSVVSLVMLRRKRNRRLRAAAAASAGAGTKHGDRLCRESLPVDVVPERLPAGWAVAPPIIHAAQKQAILPLVTPAESKAMEAEDAQRGDAVRVPGSQASEGRRPGAEDASKAQQQRAFILCEGPHPPLVEMFGATDVDMVKAVAAYVRSHPVLASAVGTATPKELKLDTVAVTTKEKADEAAAKDSVVPAATESSAADSVTAPFTHILSSKDVTVLFGVHGPYAAAAVLMGFPDESSSGASGSGATDKATTPASGPAGGATDGNVTIKDAIAALAHATVTVPYCDDVKSDDYFRFPGTCKGVHQGQLRITVTVRDRTVVFTAPVDLLVRSRRVGDGYSLSFEGYSHRTGHEVSVALTQEQVHGLTEPGNTLAVALSSAPAPAQLTELETELLNTVHIVNTTSSSDRDVEDTVITVTYTNPHLEAFFAVNDESGVVVDPILTDIAQVFYYPLGDAEGNPCVTMQQFPSFPPTWETTVKDDDELVHNVRFHFTEWDRERIECTVTSLSGLKAVQLTESKDGVRCRSYVVPKGDAILVVRYEAAAETFDATSAQLQLFLDTLHIDK